ncbi:DNA polymerase-4 [Fodinibius roseus]|uniref:DNA polymerase-4 n=1 Tax=Fodinibius roseus TaxID=1194090 RepID=A0A1M5KJR8_9BACT|nr:DNA polymerase IV [Fodinibius roseus]SHG52900.1 DNA polymerase-4 [Fodinibius roseus]
MDPSIDVGTYKPEQGVHKITDYRCVSRDHQHTSIKQRLYLHLDINCFYAQVEQKSFNLWGMPVYVGGWYRGKKGTPRGIVATSSYEARGYGIKTGMSAFEAEQICPWAIGLQAHYEKYKGISQLLEELLQGFTMTVEKYSMDEFFLDINHLKHQSDEELLLYCKELRYLIHKELGLVVSIGVANSKTYSKLASDLRKPNGITIVTTSENEQSTLYPLPLDEIWGIGPRRFKKLKGRNICTIKDAFERGYPPFQKLFGAYFGKILWEMATGRDRARVLTDYQLTKEQLDYNHTFSEQSTDPAQVRGELIKGISELAYRMRAYRIRSSHYYCFLGLQDRDTRGIGFAFTTDGNTHLDDYITYECMKKAKLYIEKIIGAGHAIRRVSIGTRKVDHSGQGQLFFQEDPNQRQFYLVQDAVNNRFGRKTIQKAAILDSVPGKTHFLDRS